MLVAASAWEGLSAELSSAAFGFQSVVSGLTASGWTGPEYQAISAAASPYIGWLAAANAQADYAAQPVRAAAASLPTSTHKPNGNGRRG
jgi:PPE-repeat protein